MQHESDNQEATSLAAEVRSFVTSFGAECEVLPAHDRVVVHLPLCEARNLLLAARMRGHRIQREDPVLMPSEVPDDYLAFSR